MLSPQQRCCLTCNPVRAQASRKTQVHGASRRARDPEHLRPIRRSPMCAYAGSGPVAQLLEADRPRVVETHDQHGLAVDRARAVGRARSSGRAFRTGKGPTAGGLSRVAQLRGSDPLNRSSKQLGSRRSATGITVHFVPESVSSFHRNHCPVSAGIGVQFAPEYARRRGALVVRGRCLRRPPRRARPRRTSGYPRPRRQRNVQAHAVVGDPRNEGSALSLR